MELRFTDCNIEDIAAQGASQCYIEGAVPLPEGHGSAEVISSGGNIVISSVSVRNGCVTLEGKLRLDFICSERDELFSFVSSAAFRHDIPLSQAEEGLTALVSARLTTLDTSGSGPINIAATADISYTVVKKSKVRLFEGISGADDLEKLTGSYTLRSVRDAGYQNVRLRDEIPFPGGDGAAKVISVGAVPLKCACVRNQDAVSIDGTLAVTALIKTHGGKYKTVNANLDYSQEASAANLPIGSECTANAVVDYFELKPMGDTGDILSAELSVTVRMSAVETNSISCVLDAYSPTLPFVCESGNFLVRSLFSSECGETEIVESISPPEGMPEIASPVCMSARAAVSSASLENGALTVDGIVFARIAYLTESNSLYTFARELPFSFTSPISVPEGACFAPDSVDVTPYAAVTATEFALANCAVSARIKLNIQADIYSLVSICAVTGIAECEKAATAPGIYVYFADAGETLFEIGKHFNVSIAKLRETNPDIEEPCTNDTKVIMLV